LTAGHVIQEIEERGLSVTIGKVINNILHHYPAEKFDIFPDTDLAIIKTKKEISDAKQFMWNTKKLIMLDEIRTVGFPHAIDFETGKLSIRSFKGYIVSETTFDRLESKPPSYELSFSAPQGLSGAPLFPPSKMIPIIKGYILGSSQIKIPILIGEEQETEEKGFKKIIESYDVSSYGVAIQTQSIIHIEYEILNGKLLDFLESNKLTRNFPRGDKFF